MIRLPAPAKINWFLEITGKRRDGYHTLSILFQTISLADQLTFTPAKQLSMSCSDASLPTDDRNLAMRAAIALQTVLKEKRGAHIHLTKRVPMGAGLGGGSSDAAAVLLGLQRVWRRSVPPDVLRKAAARLGADVPFFLEKGLCSATGIGDRLRPLPALPKLWLVLAYPGFGVATKEAYGRVRLPWEKQRSVRPALEAISAGGDALGDTLFNRFESLVFPSHPKL
jgi:4-diphosphocytidyl-2-C-methyl-D-erythritol kinase